MPSPRPAPTSLLLGEGEPRVVDFRELPDQLREGDLLVMNDAATFPGSVHFEHRRLRLEARLFEKTPRGFKAVLFGPGDFHTRTEARTPPPLLDPGEHLRLAGLDAEVIDVSPTSPRLVELAFTADDDAQWAALYEHGHVIQYAHRAERLPLWSVQNVYGARPWAAEQPSAGHALTFELLRRLHVATLTHATGLSATGDPALDAALPFPERYEIPTATLDAVNAATRVIAVGTSVVRALEAWATTGERAGVASEPIEPDTPLHVVDGLLTGIHSPGESHYRLLGAFLSPERLRAVCELANRKHLRTHENGDLALLWCDREVTSAGTPAETRNVRS